MKRLKFVLLIVCLALLISETALGNPHSPQEPTLPAQNTQPADKNKTDQQGPPPGFDFQKAIRDFMAAGEAPDPEAVKRGQAIFAPTCGFCHGSTGRGGSGGPSLVRSVLVLHDAGTGKEIFPVVHNGRISKGMPAFPLTETQVKDISAYLSSLVQATALRNEYKILNIVTGDAGKGESYFKAHCASCHSPTGDLAHIASKFEPAALEARFLYPMTLRFPGMPPPSARGTTTATVKLASGQTFSGALDKIDDFSISLTDASGTLHSWEFEAEPGITYEINDPLKTHADLLKKYSDDDMHNILTYLETLK
ncbi:MAG TPA: c-type cytochrome [Terriglobales bacterium]|nr:c-type cytochrome [Terriglobales bacterium]